MYICNRTNSSRVMLLSVNKIKNNDDVIIKIIAPGGTFLDIATDIFKE